MQDLYDEFKKRDTVVIAVAQEDDDLKKHKRIYKNFDGKPAFKIGADLGYKKTTAYKRTTAYLIDKEGVVRQIFPMLIHMRASWLAILDEVDKLDPA